LVLFTILDAVWTKSALKHPTLPHRQVIFIAREKEAMLQKTEERDRDSPTGCGHLAIFEHGLNGWLLVIG
jgi:hypothetical protein